MHRHRHHVIAAAATLALSLAFVPYAAVRHAHAQQSTGADLALSMSADPRRVAVGQDATITLTMTNKGPDTAVSPIIGAQLIATGGLWISNVNCGSGEGGADGTFCEIWSTLPPGESVSITMLLHVGGSVGTGAGIVSACAYSVTPDVRPGNDCRSMTFTFTAAG